MKPEKGLPKLKNFLVQTLRIQAVSLVLNNSNVGSCQNDDQIWEPYVLLLAPQQLMIVAGKLPLTFRIVGQ